MRKVIAVIGLVTVLGMVFAGSFLGALHKPTPHNVPVAVVGPAAQVERALAQKAPGAFDIKGYSTEQAAREALGDRDVDAVLLPAQDKLVVASAGGRTAATVVTTVFQKADPQLVVEDAIPLPEGDAGGISGMFYVLALVIPGIAIAVLLGQVAPGLGAVKRVTALAAGSLVVGTANAWLADVVFGALPNAFAGLMVISATITFTIALVAAGMLRVAGTPGVGLAALLFIPIGLPASGGPLGARFIPEWYAAVGQVLPIGQGADAIKDVVYFGGAALTVPLAVLGGWALLGLVLAVVPRRRQEAPVHQPVLVSGNVEGGQMSGFGR
jgi:hypothetical protein